MLGKKKNELSEFVPVERKPKEYDLKFRPDKIGKYYKKYLKEFVFDELSDAFIDRQGKISFMKGVPIPLRKEDVSEFHGGAGLKMTVIVENMVRVIGIDLNFKYRDSYILFIGTFYDKRGAINMVKVGRNAAEKAEYDTAIIHFRAALLLEPKDLHALYSYARVCRAIYLETGENKDEEFVGLFKAESMQFFELIVDFHPKYSQSYYYLGYAYLNMGLYMKTALIWERFLAISKNRKDKAEIRHRLEQIEEPIDIEQGYTAILAGKYSEGVTKLEPYTKSKFKDWWPLYYYLGVGYINLNRKEDALTSFKKVLTYNASHVETMEELATIYRKNGEKENEQKYKDKAKLLRGGGHKEKEIKEKNKGQVEKTELITMNTEPETLEEQPKDKIKEIKKELKKVKGGEVHGRK